MARVTLVLRALFGLIICIVAASGPTWAQTTVCGTTSADTTWTLAGSPYIVTCNVYVQGSSNPILTIEPGVEVRFRINTAMWIGWSSQGGLQVLGTSVQPVRFTSDQAAPQPGDWDGIRFGSQVDPGSRIGSALIEYAGGDTSYPGVFLVYNGGRGELDNVFFENTLDHDVYLRASTSLTATGCTLGSVYYYDNSPQSDWTGNTFVDWGATRSVLSPAGADAIGHGNTILPVPGAVTELRYGTIDEDVSLSAVPGPYVLRNNLYVQKTAIAPTLTLEPGVEIRFESGYGLYVGYTYPGELVTLGGGAPVVLTSASETPVPGSWIGVIIGAQSAGASSLNNLRIEYAGGSGSWPGALYVNAAATLDGVTFSENDRHDIYLVAGADLDVSNSTLSDFHYASTDARARWDGNAFQDWGATLSRISIEDVEALSHGNSFYQVPGAVVEILGHIVSESVSWGSGPGPYVPTNGIYVQDSTNNPTLTLEPGVELHMPAGKGLYVGTNYPGRLVTDGGGDPIILTSSQPIPAAGDWIGVVIYYNALAGTLLRNVHIAYAGGSSGYPGAVYAYYNVGATLDGVSFANNDRHDIYLAPNANLTVTGSTLSSFRYQESSASASWDGNLFYDWGSTASVVSLLGAEAVSHGNVFLPGPDARLELIGGTLQQDAVWSPAPGPYFLKGILYVQDTVNDPTLTLEPGVEIRVVGPNKIMAGYTASGGFDFTDVRLTSASETPAIGDWVGVEIGNYGRGAFSDVTIEYADIGLEILNPAATLSDLRFAHSNVGIDLRTAVPDPISGLRFDDIDTAVRATSAPVRILDSELAGNLWGVENLSPASVVDARGNWWGAADGPSGVGPGNGAAITAGVLYDPVLIAPVDDCDADGTSDTCEISCGLPGGLCDVPGCGTQSDADGNWVPDDCDLGGRVGLTFDSTHMYWTDVPPSLGYDMIHGDLHALLEVGGDFAETTNGCLFDNETSTSHLQGSDPFPGEAWFYLLRTEMPTGTESYDVIESNQIGSRDAEVLASGNDCSGG